MTAHAHDVPQPDNEQGGGQPIRAEWSTSASRPWWMMPALAAVLVVGGLVAAGILSLSTVLYVGLFGGMMLMHVGGHGMHGGHGGGGHAGHASRTADAQGDERPSGHGTGGNGEEDHDHAQHTSHGCH